MRNKVGRISCGVLLIVSAIPLVGMAADDDLASIVPFFKEHCFACHSKEDAQGGLNLQTLNADFENPDALSRWIQVHDRVAKGEMPPKGEPQPNPSVSKSFLQNLSKTLTSADARQQRPTMRRLNRVEFENTICDLFEIRISVKDLLVEDPKAFGFDTVAEALSISPEQMELYLIAANRAIDRAYGSDRAPKQLSVRIPLSRDPLVAGEINRGYLKTDDDSLIVFNEDPSPSFLSGKVPADGTYRISIQAKTYQTKNPLVLEVTAGDVIVRRGPRHHVGYFDVLPGENWTNINFDEYIESDGCIKLTPYRLRTPFLGPDRYKGPGLMIGEVSMEGPLETWPPISRQRLLGATDIKSAGVAEAQRILTQLLPRAFRRPISADEVQPFVAITKLGLDSGRPFLDSLKLGLQAVLCSPDFLMRVDSASTEDPKRISQHSLASRLSYFLWSSMPDAELTELAAAGQLSQPKVLQAQVERMLSDPKSYRFIVNFTGQWLGLRDINFTIPDSRLFPEFDDMLRVSMEDETLHFFAEVLEQNEPVMDFVDSNWAMLNERMAIHYEIPGVFGQEFRRVNIPRGNVRGGVMTQASVLKITANGTNTSPVVRGNWVLTNVLGTPSPPPPKNVPGIEPDIRSANSIREMLAKHRNIDSCAVCHNQIDPPGFAMEIFDPIGGRRSSYRTLGTGRPVNLKIDGKNVQFRHGAKVDPSGQLSDGRKFADVRSFKRLLRQDNQQIAKCLTEKLLIYAVGRPLGFSDRPAVRSIVEKISTENYGFRSLIHEVVLSPAFQQN